MAGTHEKATGGQSPGTGDLRPPVASHLSHRGCTRDHRCSGGHGRQEPQDHEIAGGEGVGEAGKEGRQRGLVDISPCQMVAGLEKIQLVPVPPVTGSEDEQKQRQRGGYEPDTPGQRW